MKHSRLNVDLCRLLQFIGYKFQLLLWVENRLFRLVGGTAPLLFRILRPELVLRLVRALRRGGTHCDLVLFGHSMAVFQHVQFFAKLFCATCLFARPTESEMRPKFENNFAGMAPF